ncbi:solute carrier family 13 member 5-like isoform X1 [Xenia sp. Carnegie-2017]|uniref:solute carrier family 13 member 5-like isoform X1 n=1 Tax=Xenia sp. Carnegie-2017 TaxID=2897299 RepID=UPI001F04F684|nr:solute carrier family 13 member 5-like isoform X1 [Xenia sp. Carnegie-2017]
MTVHCKFIWKVVSNHKRFLILTLTPLVLVPLPAAVNTKEGKCAYAILIMAVYWITEVCPLAVTSLLPLILFPVLGVVEAKKVGPPYFSDTNILFMGGLLVAAAVERWNLHKRIALFVLLKIGVQPRRLLFGFMSVTAFLSMWLSNTATTAMMVPIAQAVVKELKRGTIETRETDENTFDMNSLKDETNDASETKSFTRVGDTEEHQFTFQKQVEMKHNKFCKGIFLSIAYAANIGGTGTLTGTGPNLVLSGQSEELFPGSGGIGFADWFIYSFPQMIMLLLIAWIWIQYLYLDTKFSEFFFCRKTMQTSRIDYVEKARSIVRQQYEELGPITFAEVTVLIHFVTLTLLWLFRDPKFIDGWSILFRKGFVRDGTVGIVVAFSLFNFPSRMPKLIAKLLCRTIIEDEQDDFSYQKTLLEWDTVSRKFSWDILLLLGAGFAMAKAAKDSGLSLWLGLQLSKMDSLPVAVIVLISVTMLCGFTEVTSNTATATIFIPILGALATALQIHPWRLMIPATAACSFAFMLPVATPPNAIVFSSGYLKVTDMVKTGIVLNITGIIVLMVWLYTFGTWYFDLNTFPEWAETIVKKNSTKTVQCIVRNITA